MKYIADLHIHSRFSRATAKNLTLPVLDTQAALKGIQVLGTGDATHPGWLAEIEEQLTPAEEGLYRLKKEHQAPGGGQTRFLLSAEVSSIYKRGGKVRKVHSLILYPGCEAARAVSEKLGRLGNVTSDGRPILGLDAADLLELCLTVDENICFIPAHIWTPWFSLLGSKSGFDSVEECFGPLARHIHALETGLSSDPAMNWRLSALDRYTLVSNSDAHSPAKLAREANLLDTELGYGALVQALKTGQGFEGTIEFFPEEGKYHLDGHRKCELRLTPEESKAVKGRCPVCGRPLTLGVLHRVLDLADREEGQRPERARDFTRLVPLAEVLGQVLGQGPATKRVTQLHDELIRRLGPELSILMHAELAEIESVGGRLTALAIERMRKGRVRALGGYDGEFGTISLFEPGERERLAGQEGLFEFAPNRRGRPRKKPDPPERLDHDAPAGPMRAEAPAPETGPLAGLNPEQAQAVTAPPGPVLITAGPGTGKTHLLTRRAAWLMETGPARPGEILALTFTRAAAAEMGQRLAALAGGGLVAAHTFHSLALAWLSEAAGETVAVASEEEQERAIKKAAAEAGLKPGELARAVSLAKQGLKGPESVGDGALKAGWQRYQAQLEASQKLDYDDLVAQAVALLEGGSALAKTLQNRYKHILVDEYQDINHAQYRLVRSLAGTGSPSLTVIGDPDQAIYAFRGASAAYFYRFTQDYPQARAVSLSRNYRSTDTILTASRQVIAVDGLERAPLSSGLDGEKTITISALSTPQAEARYIAGQIEALLGGTSHYAMEAGFSDGNQLESLGFGDIAVLARLNVLATELAQELGAAGLPVQVGKGSLPEPDEGLDFKADRISVMTMHAAKGLEFKVVFVAGLEEGLLPYQPPGREPAELAEERRLLYVAMTRAKRRLFLTRSRRRTLFGRTREPGPSPFLAEIEQELVRREEFRRGKRKQEQLKLF